MRLGEEGPNTEHAVLKQAVIKIRDLANAALADYAILNDKMTWETAAKGLYGVLANIRDQCHYVVLPKQEFVEVGDEHGHAIQKPTPPAADTHIKAHLKYLQDLAFMTGQVYKPVESPKDGYKTWSEIVKKQNEAEELVDPNAGDPSNAKLVKVSKSPPLVIDET